MKLSIYGEIVDGVSYLSVEELIVINRFLITKQTPCETISVIKKNELESSQISPAQYRYYKQTQDMYALASVLINSLILNHPFANANKRTAFFSGYIFLLLNGYELTAPEDEVVEMILGIANKKYTREELENWICFWSRDFDARYLSVPTDIPLFSDMLNKIFVNR